MKEGSRVALIGAPDGFDEIFRPLPDEVVITRRLAGTKDVIVLFVTTFAQLRKRWPAARKAMDAAAGLWIAWPKKASGVPTDLDFGVIQSFALDQRLVDNKSCAIDETWSGLRFVIRLADR